MHVTGDACSWNSMIRCWVRMSHMITDPGERDMFLC